MSLSHEKHAFVSLGARAFAVPAPVFLVGSYDAQGRPNIMAASWGGLCASQPPCLSVSLTRARWTFASITRRKAFTVSIPSADMAAQADFTGLTSGRDVDKFATLGLTPLAAEHVDAPYVAECPAAIELRLVDTLEMGSHSLFVGEIMDVKLHSACVDANGVPRMEALNPLLFTPLAREYWSVGSMVAKAFSVGHSAGRQAVIDRNG